MEELFKIKSRFGEFEDYRISKSGIVYSLRQGNVIKPLASNSLDTSGYPMVFLLDKMVKSILLRFIRLLQIHLYLILIIFLVLTIKMKIKQTIMLKILNGVQKPIIMFIIIKLRKLD